MSAEDFYDRLEPFYHLIFPDWDESIQRQAQMLDMIIREAWGDQVHDVLDATCGIGTQAIGLAQQGYRVTASDLSSRAVQRAQREAEARGVDLRTSQADVRHIADHYDQQFDLVISCDNSLPHLLTDDDLLLALEQMYACLRPGGGCLISLRDYVQEKDVPRCGPMESVCATANGTSSYKHGIGTTRPMI